MNVLLALTLILPGAGDDPPGKSSIDVAAPERLLLADGQPVDNGAHAAHGGPLLLDHDGDGHKDLLLGNLRGTIELYRGAGEGRFQPAAMLEGADGKEIKLHNW